MKKLLCLFFIVLSSNIYAAEKKSSANSQNYFRDLQEAQFYFLLDADTKEILLAKNPDVRIPPSSMTKVMTAYVVFDQIQKGRIKFDNQCLIGKDAWRKSGSTMFLNYGDIVTIDELLKGLLAVSGNDAAIALAQTTAGGLNNFVNLMNVKARELGLKNSHFKNPHGLYEEGHYMSVRDLAILTSRIYQDFPQYSHYLGIQQFTYHNIVQQNRNPLIKQNYEGVLGGKTGHTDAGGYGVLGAVRRDDRTLIAVVNKAPTPKKRAAIITELLDYGFNYYNKLTLFHKDQEVVKIPTWLGSDSEVKAIIDREVAFNIPREKSLSSITVKVKYKEPLYAPISKGDKIATLSIEVKDYKNFEYSLFAKESVDKAGYLKRIAQIARYKINEAAKIFSSKNKK
ncbi:MAG: D-alanyl-D-alanine carboxypeptidase family protein [Rickettsiales bacterium]|nr:D-alanyl-D-alanine carboxypeptidase family protein [Rickettsiales bacterium]